MPCVTGYCAGAEVGSCDGCGAWVGADNPFGVDVPSWDEIPDLPEVTKTEIKKYLTEAAESLGSEVLQALPSMLPEFVASVMTDAGEILSALEMPQIKLAITTAELINQINNPREVMHTAPEWYWAMRTWWTNPARRAEDFARYIAEAVAKDPPPETEPYKSEWWFRTIDKNINTLVPQITLEQARYLQKKYAPEIRKFFSKRGALKPYKGGGPSFAEHWGHKLKSTGLPKIYKPAKPPADIRATIPTYKKPVGRINPRIHSPFGFKVTPVVQREKPKKKRKVKKDMPKRKKTKSRKVNVPHVEAKAIEKRKLRVLSRIYALFRKGQVARAKKLAAKLARV